MPSVYHAHLPTHPAPASHAELTHVHTKRHSSTPGHGVQHGLQVRACGVILDVQSVQHGGARAFPHLWRIVGPCLVYGCSSCRGAALSRTSAGAIAARQIGGAGVGRRLS